MVILKDLLRTALRNVSLWLAPILPMGYSMVESTLGIMTFFEWAFALASLSEGLGFSTFLHNSTEVQGKSEDLQAKQFEFSWLLGLLCFQNNTGHVRTQGRPYRSFGSGLRDGHPGSRISSLLLGYFFAVKSVCR
jgi:hypothetical protein